MVKVRLKHRVNLRFTIAGIVVAVATVLAFAVVMTRSARAITSMQGPLTVTSSANCVADSTSSGAGTVAWTGVSNAAYNDGAYATTSLKASTSHYIKCTGFNFSVPSYATINGIVMSVRRKSNVVNSINDAQIRLYKNGVIGATNRATTTLYATYDETGTYGSSTDLWGDSWTPADINATGFGAAIAATKPTSGSAATVSIDAVSISVHYTLPQTMTQSAYKFFNNSTNAGEVGTQIAAQNTPVTAPSAGQPFRLRMLIDIADAEAPVVWRSSYSIRRLRRACVMLPARLLILRLGRLSDGMIIQPWQMPVLHW